MPESAARDALESALHIHHFGPTRVINRESRGVRWCFRCRRHVEFEYTLTADIEPSYYDPTPRIQCATARHVNGDLFPGRERHWDYGP